MFNEKILNFYAILSFTFNLILVVDVSIVCGVLTFVRLNTTKKLASRHVTHYICVYICDHIHTFIYFRLVAITRFTKVLRLVPISLPLLVTCSFFGAPKVGFI